MRLAHTPEDVAFGLEVREFVRTQLPAPIRWKLRAAIKPTRAEYVDWYQRLHERGWATPSWPKEWGGTGWTGTRRGIFDQELALGGAPRMNSAGILMLGPMLIRYGTEEQKARFLPDIQRSTVWWAQGFSEPESGSDLASVRTRATLRGDAYIVEGRKIWTSYAHFSDMMFCLVRTGGPGTRPQEGISLLLLDMQSKGVSVRPIPTTDRGDDLNEVVLDGVEVPKQNLVGQEGQGWECAKYLLGFERASMAGIGDAKQLLQLVKNVSSRPDVRGLTPLEDPAFASQVRQLEIELVALEATAMRLTASDRTATYPGMVTPMLKVLGTELRQKLTRLALEAGGLDAIGWPSNDDEQAPTAAFLSRSVGARYLDARKFSIYGGTNEIQRSLIGRALLSNG